MQIAALGFGVERVEEVAIGVHQGKIDDDDLTGLAPILLRAADAGDAVARALVSRLADEIAVMAVTAMRRLGLVGLATPVILGGGVITAGNELLLTGITRQLAEAAPAARVRVIDVPPDAKFWILNGPLMPAVPVRAPAPEPTREVASEFA